MSFWPRLWLGVADVITWDSNTVLVVLTQVVSSGRKLGLACGDRCEAGEPGSLRQ